MAHDPVLEQRLAEMLLAMGAKAVPKRMFGGVAFMLNGNMCVGITNKSHLMVRFDPMRHAEIAEWHGALPMTYGKGEMKGFLFVDPDTIPDRKGLERWVKLALAHARTLPPKPVKKASTASKAKPAKKAAKKAGRQEAGAASAGTKANRAAKPVKSSPKPRAGKASSPGKRPKR
ncbi:MAG: TfoX/Sxy family protein [Flavobacteriales bacterium]|nr:TfoX/Sxy family protein [Flavobacteriales bacterium]